jgi:outer membrane immunogenic protein
VSYAVGALVTTASYSSGAFAVITPQVSTHFNGHIVRAGLNYHFNWGAPGSIVAKY